VTWDGHSVNQIAMSFEISNNGFHDHQQAQAPVSILLGPLTMTGTISFEWDEAIGGTPTIDADARAGYDSANEWPLVVEWGSTPTDGNLKLSCAVCLNGQPTQTEVDGYQQLTVPWRMISGTVTPTFITSAAAPFDMIPPP
jgi:hypothetical protein